MIGASNAGDSVTASQCAIYLVGTHAHVSGGANWVDFQSGTDSATLTNTAGAWDWVTAMSGSVTLAEAQATIEGDGNAIALTGGPGDAVALIGASGVGDSVTASQSAIYLMGAKAEVSGENNWIDLQSGTDSATLTDTAGVWDCVTAATGASVMLDSAQSVVQGGGVTITLTGSGTQ